MNTLLNSFFDVYLVPDGTGTAVDLDINWNFLITSPNFQGYMSGLTVTPDGTLHILTTDRLYVYDFAAEQATLVATLPSGSVGIVNDADGRLYVSSNASSVIPVLAGSGGYGAIDVLQLPSGAFSKGDMLVQGDQMYVLTSEKTLVTFDLDSGDIVAEVSTGNRSFYSLSANDDGLLAYRGDDVYSLDPLTGETQRLGEIDDFRTEIWGSALLEDGYALDGTAGNDRLKGTMWGDLGIGGLGDDRILGLAGDDNLAGQGGSDTLVGGVGQDTLRGGQGEDSLLGGDEQDVLRGQAGEDTLRGGAGNDNAKGGGGGDLVRGEGGNDFLTGGTESDNLQGGPGQDRLFGNRDNDLLFGDAGDDVLKGGGGDDVLNGGRGNDFHKGGTGADVFDFNGSSFGSDRVVDFEDGIDLIQMTGLSFAELDIESAAFGTRVQSSAGEVLLLGVDRAQIDESDFLF